MKYIFTFIALLLAPIQAAHATMNNQYAMVFFFRSDCAYCHAFAPTLKQFTQANSLPTYAFTLDGKSMGQFPVPIPATPEVSQLFFDNPRSITVPATFLINVNTRKFVRVSVGNVSYQQLEHSVNGILSDSEVLEAMR
ncbi:type-F conjugative transfer system pilin assembly thiol-disulfide isomerase TrbB [Vibrio sp. 10N.247.311.51]|uniref:type-F conjugative transfer system pilin assembly thiol-disulfide isomerase TrbB n=1 Tax=Vibrio sp. 10N.247.311.51 TaxID=3229996 RepID=UPI003551EB2B